MNSNDEQQQQQQSDEDDSSLNRGRSRQDAKRSRRSLPEPDNVVPVVNALSPTFRDMPMQSRGPSLLAGQPALKIAKSALSPNYEGEAMPESSEQKLKATPQQQKPVSKVESQPSFGWDKSRICVENVQKLPMFFPKDMIQWEFSSEDLFDVLERISKQFRESSIQASLIHEPLSAKLQTCHENAELYLVFFNNPSGMVSMSLQRHKGDHIVANRFIRQLVDAAKGELSANDKDGSNVTVSAAAVEKVEEFLARCEKENSTAKTNDKDGDREEDQHHPFWNQTPDQMTESAVREVGGWLVDQPRRLDLRRQALEYLLALTDLKQTMRTTAIAISLIVLKGKVLTPVTSELKSHPEMIQSILLEVLLTRELSGDRAMLAEDATNNHDREKTSNTSNDVNLEIHPYFPEVDEDVIKAAADLPQHYTEFMNGLFNLALQILVQSLEVVACFPESFSSNGINMGNQLFEAASRGAYDKDLYHTLLSCVSHVESKLANGYLACKALRLLASDCPDIKDKIKIDKKAEEKIENALQVGLNRHTLLKEECHQLKQIA